MISKFISNRNNLTVLQCILYIIVGYIMSQHLDLIQMGIMFILLFGIQFVTRTKGVADGMVFRQLMLDHKMKANEIVEKIKEQAKEAKKNNDIN